MSTLRKTNKTRRSEKLNDDKPPTKREKADKEKPETYSIEAKAAMRQFVSQIVQNGIHSLRLQYAEIKTFVPADPSKKHFDANQPKCRYKDVPCWDKTRLVLTWPPGASSDFLHANWVTHHLIEYQFICCQGPLDATIGDFWRCVWQEKVKQIVMLCRCQELGKDKCAQYWPLAVGDSMSHFGLTIKCEKVDSSDRSFVHTKLQLTYEKEVRNVDHRQWTTWPDKSVPKTPMAPFRLLQFTRKSPKNPTIIHCSAGVGRTGTLVAVELVYQSLVHAKVPDVVSLVKEIRSQRSTAVQTEDQFIYIHYAILQLFHIKAVVPAHFVRHFIKEYETYLKLLNDNGGKNLPIQATSLPNPCAKCVKIAAHLNEVSKEEQPSSELKQESKRERRKKKDDNTDYEKASTPEHNKDLGSKKEKRSDAASKKEKKGSKNNDKKAKLLRKLKDKNKEKEKNQKGDEKKNIPDTPTEVPSQLPFAVSSLPPPQSFSSFPQKPTAEPAFSQPMVQNFNGSEVNNEVKLPTPEESQMRQNPNVPPFQLQQSYTSAQQNIQQQFQQPQFQAQQPSVPVPTPAFGAPIQNDIVVAQQPPQPNPPPFQYKPPATYVIQQAGDKNAIVYNRNNAQPYVKAIAAPPGQIQPQILVNMNGESTPPPPPPSHPPPSPQPQQRQPGVPFFENNNPWS